MIKYLNEEVRIGNGELWIDFKYIFNVKLIMFGNGLDWGCGNKSVCLLK